MKDFIRNAAVEDYKNQLQRCAFAIGSYYSMIHEINRKCEGSSPIKEDLENLSQQISKDINYLFYEERI